MNNQDIINEINRFCSAEHVNPKSIVVTLYAAASLLGLPAKVTVADILLPLDEYTKMQQRMRPVVTDSGYELIYYSERLRLHNMVKIQPTSWGVTVGELTVQYPSDIYKTFKAFNAEGDSPCLDMLSDVVWLNKFGQHRNVEWNTIYADSVFDEFVEAVRHERKNVLKTFFSCYTYFDLRTRENVLSAMGRSISYTYIADYFEDVKRVLQLETDTGIKDVILQLLESYSLDLGVDVSFLSNYSGAAKWLNEYAHKIAEQSMRKVELIVTCGLEYPDAPLVTAIGIHIPYLGDGNHSTAADELREIPFQLSNYMQTVTRDKPLNVDEIRTLSHIDNKTIVKLESEGYALRRYVAYAYIQSSIKLTDAYNNEVAALKKIMMRSTQDPSIASKRDIAYPASLGEVLEEYVEGAGGVEYVASVLDVQTEDLNALIRDEILPDAKWFARLAVVFDSSPDYWINIHMNYLLHRARGIEMPLLKNLGKVAVE